MLVLVVLVVLLVLLLLLLVLLLLDMVGLCYWSRGGCGWLSAPVQQRWRHALPLQSPATVCIAMLVVVVRKDLALQWWCARRNRGRNVPWAHLTRLCCFVRISMRLRMMPAWRH